MKTLLSIFNMVAVLTLLVLLGLAGYLAATGRLDNEKLQTMLDMVRQTHTPPDLRQQVYTVFTAPPATATAPATGPATTRATGLAVAASQMAASAAERLDYARQVIELEQLRLDHEAQELQHRQQLLDQKRAQIDANLAQLDAAQKKFREQVAATQAQTRSAAFTKTLDLYNELKTKQVKDILGTLNPDAAAEFLKAMDSERAAKIIAEFKTPEEKASLSSILEKIRTGTDPSGTPSASVPATTAPAEAIPATAPAAP